MDTEVRDKIELEIWDDIDIKVENEYFEELEVDIMTVDGPDDSRYIEDGNYGDINNLRLKNNYPVSLQNFCNTNLNNDATKTLQVNNSTIQTHHVSSMINQSFTTQIKATTQINATTR